MTDSTPPNVQPVGVATVVMNIRFRNHADVTRWGNSTWKTTGVSLQTSVHEWHGHLSHWILEARNETYREYEQDLSSRGRMIRTATYFEFGDIRDEKFYIAREHDEWRVETIKDLLLTTDAGGGEPIINLLVKVDDIPVPKSDQGSSKPSKAPISIKYHRYGIGKTNTANAADIQQQHELTTMAILMPYLDNADDETEFEPIVAMQRRVNNSVIGSIGDMLHPKGQVDNSRWTWIAPYKDLDNNEERGAKMEEIIRARIQSGEGEEPGIPRLPFVTLLPYKQKNGVDGIAKGNISLAIRVRSHLNAIQGGVIDLPLDWVKVVESHMTFNKLCGVLCNGLQDGWPSPGVVKLGDKMDKWRLGVWVMPQGNQREKLHFMRRDEQLYQYLDPALVSGGERKLYIELHFCVR